MEIAIIIILGLGIVEGSLIYRELKERNELLRANIAAEKIVNAIKKQAKEEKNDRT